MVEALFDLDHVLRSKREQLSLEEANVLMAWKTRAKRDFYLGLGGGSIVSWLATQRLRGPLRSTLSFGAGAACGVWLLTKSLESSVEHILSLEGSRLQRELANVLLKKHNGDPRAQQHLSKHFYSEEVYDDSSADRPLLRWRYWNFFEEHVTHSQSTSYNEDANSNNVEKTTMEPKQVNVSDAAGNGRHKAIAADDATENPFDFIFGLAGSADDVAQLDARKPTTSSRKQMRREKRSRRRHRQHHDDESDI